MPPPPQNPPLKNPTAPPPPPETDPARKIVVGRFGAPRGTQGWMHVATFGDGQSLLKNDRWWCAPGVSDLNADGWRWMQVEAFQFMGGGATATKAVAKIAGVDDRDVAARWTNGGIAVRRDSMPPPAEGQYYWCDLIGLRAIGEEGEPLGIVCGMMETGAHDVLRIEPEGGGEILAPFVDEYVQEVDLAGGAIRLRWRRDW